MKDHSLIEDIGVGVTKAAGILDEALAGADDGEIFVEFGALRELPVRRRPAEVGLL